MKRNFFKLILPVAFIALIIVSCTRMKADEMIIGTWKVDTIFAENVDTSQITQARLDQASDMQKKVYFVVHENGQMDLISPFGAKTANWTMDNDSLILTAEFIDTKQISRLLFDEITETKLVLKEESPSGIFTTVYVKQ